MNVSKLKGFVKRNLMLCILFLVCVVIALTAPGFFTIPNFLNILRNNSLKGVIAAGMTMVLICGEIDLSVSSTVALSGVITALTAGALDGAGIMDMKYGVLVGMLLAFLVAIVVGSVNGYIRVKYNIPTFIITIAMMNLLYGVAAIISGGFPVTTLPTWYSVLGAGQIFGIIPVPAVILIIVFIIASIIMNRTKIGREIYAVGGNIEAARLSGINVKKVKLFVMISVQCMAVLAGIMTSAQVMSGSQNFGKAWETDVVSAVIIGGTSMAGGIGKVGGTFVGLIFLGVLINGMTLLNINEYAQYIVRGALILFAVLINAINAKQSN